MRVNVERLARDYDRASVAALIPGKTIIADGWDVDGSFYVQTSENLSASEADAIALRLTTTDSNEEATRTRAWNAADGLRQIRDSTGVLTATSLSNAVRLIARVVLHLLRLQLGRTDVLETEPGAVTPTPVAPEPGRRA